MDTREETLLEAIRTLKRLGSKPTRAMLRQLSNLHHFTQWQRKAKLAQTKLKIYKRKINAYERRTKRS